jgi:hypothetical protein
MSPALLAAVIGLVQPGQVTLRGGEAAPAGAVVRADQGGVWLAAENAGAGSAPKMVVGWDRVKGVGGAQADKAKEWLDAGERAWRARTRLERGDFISAESLFEPLFETYRTQAGVTAAVIDEGLLRCRLRRGAHVGAVEPWLAYLGTARGDATPRLHGEWAAEAGLSPVIDAQTGLVAALPPIFLAWPSVEAMARGSAPGGVGAGDPKAAYLAALYLAAAKFEAGEQVGMPALATSDAGVGLVAEIVRSRIGSAPEREEARKLLQARIAAGAAGQPSAAGQALPPWMEAWCRAALGRSYLREDAPELKRLGLVELLHVPARFSNTHPYLAGIALAEASVTLRQLGDAQGADVLAQELDTIYPSHPVQDWRPLRSTRPPPRSAAAPAPKPAEGAAPAAPPSGPEQNTPPAAPPSNPPPGGSPP